VNRLDQVPLVWNREGEIRARLDGKALAVFLDYDGTLTPIVEDYTKAILSDAMRRTIAELARHYTVAIVSGRDVTTMRGLIRLDSLFYAGSHGFEIGGPKGWHDALVRGVEALPELDRAEHELREALRDIKGHAVERKRFEVAIHYRRAAAADVDRIERIVDQVASRHPQLRKGIGKKVFQFQPDIDWDKGHAVLWLLERLGLDRRDVLPIYIGDDVTDEDALRVLQERGLGIVVRGEDNARPTAARYALANCNDVQRFLETLVTLDPRRMP
jgi:trehalose 6-phosphate phosphatase